ncbi:rhodanese-like domain-containing protein [Desulfocurvibacter africanus]|uniref:Rhodanese-like protein n=1 Tax=Desulfocurvibacter africanus subsp. africanus str. Walvis Bay TaxID=690850 RepID=F3Z475_DESAF|nr:rhodanese-like domain-containing protein [Desulfocurvibacter africanus]EGJ51617.1 Rhodanese-like protein [Desulfocurvibacter africanus subsp. africanus str. Walvis Bay]
MQKAFVIITLVLSCAVLLPITAVAQTSKETEHEQILRISRNALTNRNGYTPEALHEIISKKDNAYYILSLQSEQDYAKGHIPGAVRLPLNLRDPAPALAMLPKHKPILVTCENGQRSCQAVLFLRQLGYDAGSLMLGLEGWNRAYAGKGAYTGKNRLPVTTQETALQLGPVAPSSPSGLDDTALILKRTAEYASHGRPVSVSPQDVAAMKDEAVIITMQSPEDYAYGHIAGAASLPASAFIGGAQELLRLPRDKKIIVTCYMGHYSNIGALLLNQLGYEAYSLDWGLAGWNPEGLRKPIPWLVQETALPVETSETQKDNAQKS